MWIKTSILLYFPLYIFSFSCLLILIFLIFQFVVFKYLRGESDCESDDDDVLFDVGLAPWLTTLDENMEGLIKWPPLSQDAGMLVKREKPVCPDWMERKIQVKRFYGKYINTFFKV